MQDVWMCIAAVCIGVPISVFAKWGTFCTAMFCGGLEIVLTQLCK
jgi:hypothetical protein